MGKKKNKKRMSYGPNILLNKILNQKRPDHHSSGRKPDQKPQPPLTPNPNPKPIKLPTFPTYLDTPNLVPKVKLLCEIIANAPATAVDKLLEGTGHRVSQNDVEQILKLSYSFPDSALKFFSWAGYQLNDNHSPYSWNLVVDLLGKNFMFEQMWDTIKSMRKEALVSLATFASVFSSFVIAGRVQEAIESFEAMELYGCVCDVVALNTLLSAICRDGKTVNAVEFLRYVKDRIRPDADTYAILFEGCENEGNVACARNTFGDMVIEIGWDPKNVPAYDAFLNTFLKVPDGIHEAMKFFNIMKGKKCYPGMNFFRVALDLCVRNGDSKGAGFLWESMMERIGEVKPDTQMYNSIIALHCYLNDIDVANRFLDEMVYNGVFPDSQTYNVLFQFLVKTRKLREASAIFTEMIKNECGPNQENCVSAVRAFVDSGDSYMAIKVWKFAADNYKSVLDRMGNILIDGLCGLNRVPEAVKYAEDMIDRGINLGTYTLSRLRQSLVEAKKEFVYHDLSAKLKLARTWIS